MRAGRVSRARGAGDRDGDRGQGPGPRDGFRTERWRLSTSERLAPRRAPRGASGGGKERAGGRCGALPGRGAAVPARAAAVSGGPCQRGRAGKGEAGACPGSRHRPQQL